MSSIEYLVSVLLLQLRMTRLCISNAILSTKCPGVPWAGREYPVSAPLLQVPGLLHVQHQAGTLLHAGTAECHF